MAPSWLNIIWVCEDFSSREVTIADLPLDSPGITGPGPADQAFNISFTFVVDSTGLAFLVNGVQCKPSTIPILLKVFSGANETSDFDPTGNAIIINLGSIVEINVTGFPSHPFHLQCVLPPFNVPHTLTLPQRPLLGRRPKCY